MHDRTLRSIVEGQELLTAAPATTVHEAARQMKKFNVGAVMVVEKDRLVGIFTERDALFRVLAEGRDVRSTTLAEVMTRDPQTIGPDQLFIDALRMMHDGRYRHVPVVEEGRLIGVVTARQALGPELEGLVYEILRQEQYEGVLA